MCKLILALLLSTILTATAPATHHHSTPKVLATSVNPTQAKIRPVQVVQKPKTVIAPIPMPKPQKKAIAVAQPKPIVYPVGCSNYLSDFEKYDWNVSVAMAICQAESSGRPNAQYCGNYDGVCDDGIMQLHGIALFDPHQNIAYAYYNKYLPAGGFTPWTTYTSGAYLRFL